MEFFSSSESFLVGNFSVPTIFWLDKILDWETLRLEKIVVYKPKKVQSEKTFCLKKGRGQHAVIKLQGRDD